MAQVSGPWNGSILGDAIANAPYSSEFWAAIWRDLMHANGTNEGVLIGSGIAPDIGLTVQQTTPASANIQVTPGAAIVYGRWFRIDSTAEVLAIASNSSGNPRIDRVVARLDPVTQTIRVRVIQGTPAGSPAAPGITQTPGGTWEMQLARVAVANGFATLTDADITPEWTPGGAATGVYLEHIQNRSGAELELGDVVIWDTAHDRAVTTTTTPGVQIAGIWQGYTGNLGYGRILVDGIGLVKTNGAVARGARIMTTTVAKKGADSNGYDENAFGFALAAAANGYTLARVKVGIEQVRNVSCIYYTPGVLNTGSTTFVDADATNLKATGITHTSRLKVTFILAGWAAAGNVAHFTIKNQTSGSTAGDASKGLAHAAGADRRPVTVSWIFTALTPGTNYEFRLQYCIQTLGDNAFIGNDPVVIMVEEV